MDWLKELWENLNKPVETREEKPKLSVGNGGNRRISEQEYKGYVGNLNSGSLSPRAAENGNMSRAASSTARPRATDIWGPPKRVSRPETRSTPFAPSPNQVDRGMGVGAVQRDEFADMIESLQGQMQGEFAYDGRYDQMIADAFGAQLSAIANARNQTQGNFNESSSALKDLYAGHVQDINTVDAGKYKQINQQLQGNLNQNYDSSINAIKADSKADMAEGEDMLRRMGLQDAAPQLLELQQSKGDALARLQEEKASALTQATEYGNADQTRNIARGQSVAGEGIQRQGDLRSQLQDILGDLSMREADIQKDRAMTQMEAEQMAREEWMGQREYAGDTLEMLLQQRTEENMAREEMQMRRQEMELESQEKQAQNAPPLPLWDQVGSNLGVNIAPYRNAYADISSEGRFNSREGSDRVDYFVKRMRDMGLDPSVALQVVQDIENAGTLKRQ